MADNKDANDKAIPNDTSEPQEPAEPASEVAESNEEPKPQPEEKPSALRTIRNVLIGVLVLVTAVVGGFAWAVKTGKLSEEQVAMLNEELGLYRLPYVGNGKYFPVPEGVEWPPKPEAESEPEQPENPTRPLPSPRSPSPPKSPPKSR